VAQNFRALRTVLPERRTSMSVKANPPTRPASTCSEEKEKGPHSISHHTGQIDNVRSARHRSRVRTFGNTIKNSADIAQAYARGFAGSRSTPNRYERPSPSTPRRRVECRIAPEFRRRLTPFGYKFGCAPMAAAGCGDTPAARLRPRRVLSRRLQQLDPGACGAGIHSAASIFDAVN